VTIRYDLLHVVPPQSAPQFLKQSPLAVADDPKGWVEVDQHTMQHVRYPDVFALGDCASSPNSKTGAAVRKQAPVVAANVASVLGGTEPTAVYDGYSSCPIVTGYGTMLLAEFDYTGRPHPTIPLIDTTRERRDMWLLKRYGLPFLYWHLMLRGLA
jgi:sulfide:quinone oxidoreductase